MNFKARKKWQLILMLLCGKFAIFNAVADERNIQDSYFIKFKPPSDSVERYIELPQSALRGRTPFGQHNSGQSKELLRQKLDLDGEVVAIYDALNTIHVKAGADEIERMKNHPAVQEVAPNGYDIPSAQINPGWALDRMDSANPATDNIYNDVPHNGAGRTIYIMDSGLDLSNPLVANEFGGRATVVYDHYGGNGSDCHGHGTMVASAAGGVTHGTAKGANLIVAKITSGCQGGALYDASIAVLNWLANNAMPGAIVNWSRALPNSGGCWAHHTMLQDAFQATANAGLIVVVGAGNDGCDATNFTPTSMDDVFTVGGTSSNRFSVNQEEIWSDSTGSTRLGSVIDTFAPAANVKVQGVNGLSVYASGTSLSSPLVAGMIATACAYIAPFCEVNSIGVIFNAFRGAGDNGTVVGMSGGALPLGTPSRFIAKKW